MEELVTPLHDLLVEYGVYVTPEVMRSLNELAHRVVTEGNLLEEEVEFALEMSGLEYDDDDGNVTRLKRDTEMMELLMGLLYTLPETLS